MPARPPSPALLTVKLAIDRVLMGVFDALLHALARPMLRMATGTWPPRAELTAFRAAFVQGHHHLPRLFHALSCTPSARFYLIDTMLAACRNVAPTAADSAAHAAFAGQPIAFMHIEKAAGSSVIGFFERRFSLPQIMPLPPTWEQADARLREPQTRDYALVHGHYDLPALRRHAPERLVVAFLRDPSARILSLYYYWRSRQLSLGADDVNQATVLAGRLGLLDFLRCDLPALRNQIDNVYVRRLTGLSMTALSDPLADDTFAVLDQALAALDSLAFVGITERMPDSLDLLSRRLALVPPAHVPRLNVTAENRTIFPGDFEPVAHEPITPEIDAELARLTRLDRVVYGLAVRRLDAAVRGGAATCPRSIRLPTAQASPRHT